MLKLVKVTHELKVRKGYSRTDANEYTFDDVVDAKDYTFVIDTVMDDETLIGELVECYTRVDNQPTLGVVREVIPYERREDELRRTARFGGLMPCFTFASDHEANWALRAYLAENPGSLWEDEDDEDDEDGYDDSEEETEDEDTVEDADEFEEKEDEEELVF